MKILQITASYKPSYIYGGPIYSVSALCEGLVERAGSLQTAALDKKQGIRSKDEGLNRSEVYSTQVTEIEVITTLANGKEELPYLSGEEKIVDGVKVRYFKRWTKDHSHFSPALLIWLWKNSKKYDVIHVHAWWNFVSMGAVIICLLRGNKPIISPRGMLSIYSFNKSKKLFHDLIGKYLLKKCVFHATTLMEAEEIANKVCSNPTKGQIVNLMDVEQSGFYSTIDEKLKAVKIYVLHNLVSLPINLPKKENGFDGTLKLIFLSRIDPKKGIELLLYALAISNIPFSLTIVGEGDRVYVNYLKQKAESLGIIDYILWKGSVYNDNKYTLLAEHDLFVLTSHNENFANVVIEALAVGIPVLVSKEVGLKEWIIQNNFGYVTNLDSKSISNQLKSHYDLLKLRGKFEIKKLDSQIEIKKQYIKLYERIY